MHQRLFVGFALFCLAWLSVPAVDAEEIAIAEGDLRCVWKQGELSFGKRSAERPFLSGVQLGPDAAGATCRAERTIDPVWGQGQSLVIDDATGDRSLVLLFDSLPFVVVKRVIVNRGQQERTVVKDATLQGTVDVDLPPDALQTISTAGLLGADDHPGGYSFMAIGDPLSRRGVVCGWLTHARGTGIVFSDVLEGAAALRARIDYGDLRVGAGREVETETLLVGRFDDVRIGLEQYADAIASQLQICLPPQPSVYCTWYHGGASDAEQIARNTDFVQQRMVPYGFHVMQIDDRWQAGESKNGPRKDFSRVLPEGPYPDGMAGTATYIAAQGLVPGIWFMPFAGTWNDPYWADKQDLFYREGRSADNYIAETNGGQRPDYPPGEAPYVVRWGGTCLDMTNPKTQDYLRSIVNRIAKEWGYRYFKMDGLWTATGTRLQYVNSAYQDDDLGLPTRFNPALTPIEAYRRGLDIVRETAGQDVFLLGCCANQNMRSFGPAFGKVDAMRVGPDNGATPQGLVRGPLFSTRVFFLNKRVWYNDPDPVYVRESFPLHMAQTSVSWTALTGSLHSSSYSYYELPPERLDILCRSLPAHGLKTVRPVDYLEHDPARIWLLTDDRQGVRRDVIGLFNWDIGNSARIEYPLDRIGLDASKTYAGFDYWNNQYVPPLRDTLAADLLPGGCKIIALRPVCDHPQVLSTSRHVTQGIVDLSGERWDANAGTLSGHSQIVGGDDYELRVIVPTGENSWLIREASVSGDATVHCDQQGPAIRVRIGCPHSGGAAWTLHFERGPVAAREPAPVSGLRAAVDLDRVTVSWQPQNAYGYRVLRNGAVLAEQAETGYTDAQPPFGQSCTYAVQTKGWDGQWSTPATVVVEMPDELALPAVPPKPDVSCTELKPLKSATGFGTFGINRSCVGKPLALEGVVYADGLGVHAPSTVVYRIPQGATRFVATVGIDDEKRTDERSSIVFRVVGDVAEMGEEPEVLARSPVLRNNGHRVWHFDVGLHQRLREIQLVVEDAGDGRAADHADWVNAGFVME
jgi:hypothetical protein